MVDLSYLPIEYSGAPDSTMPGFAVDTTAAPTSFDYSSLFPSYTPSQPVSAAPAVQTSAQPQGSYGFADQTGFAPHD